MTPRSRIRRLWKSLRPGARKAAARPRPLVEALEDRALPSVAFAPPVRYDVGAELASLAVGDFNGDGMQDLAVAQFSPTVSVLLGNGGTFPSAVTVDNGEPSSSVSVGDFNGDGQQDLATSNLHSNNVSVFLGRGDGTFQTAFRYAAGGGPESVAVGDFNGDGMQDLAVANYSSDDVSVLLGQGDGSFQGAVTL